MECAIEGSKRRVGKSTNDRYRVWLVEHSVLYVFRGDEFQLSTILEFITYIYAYRGANGSVRNDENAVLTGLFLRETLDSDACCSICMSQRCSFWRLGFFAIRTNNFIAHSSYRSCRLLLIASKVICSRWRATKANVNASGKCFLKFFRIFRIFVPSTSAKW